MNTNNKTVRSLFAFAVAAAVAASLSSMTSEASAAERITVGGTVCTTESADVRFPIEALRALNTVVGAEGAIAVMTAHGTTRVHTSRVSRVAAPTLRTLPSGNPQACVRVEASLSASNAVVVAKQAAK